MLIVCDSDFLVKLANDPLPNFDRSILVENELATLESVKRELIGMASAAGKTSRRARRALASLGVVSADVPVVVLAGGEAGAPAGRGDVDSALLQFVEQRPRERALASLDHSLLSRCENLGLSYLTLKRDRAFLRMGRSAGQPI